MGLRKRYSSVSISSECLSMEKSIIKKAGRIPAFRFLKTKCIKG